MSAVQTTKAKKGSLKGLFGAGPAANKAPLPSDLDKVQLLKAGLALPFPTAAVLAPPEAAPQHVECTEPPADPSHAQPSIPAAHTQPEEQPPQGEGHEGSGPNADGLGTRGGHQLVAGASVGLPVMDFVPISINEMKREARAKDMKGGAAQKGGIISGNMMKKDAKNAVKRKYIMGLEEGDESGGSEDEGVKQKRHKKQRASGSGHQPVRQQHKGAELDSDESSSSSDDDEDAVCLSGKRRGGSAGKGGMHKGHLRGQDSSEEWSEEGDQHEDVQGVDEVVAFDYAAAHQAAQRGKKRGGFGQGRGGDRGRGRGGRADSRGGRSSNSNRGGNSRGGRGGAQQQGGRGGRPAFNPYHIPDENLVKAGKRSSVMPRSGNRQITFKK